MHVARLTLTDFRNHARTILSAGPGLVVLAGSNGAGKTNILEALSLLSPGRGLRAVPLPDMARQGGGGGFSIAAQCLMPPLAHPLAHPLDDAGHGVEIDRFATGGDAVDEPAGDHGAQGVRAHNGGAPPPVMIGTGVTAAAPGRRRVRINGAESTANALGEWLAMLWLTPAMDRLFADGAGQRRRFLDRMTLALFPQHARHASRYDAAMRARTRLLTGDAPLDLGWISALESQMAEHGAALDHGRQSLLSRVRAQVDGAPESLFARPKLALTAPDGAPAPMWQPGPLAAALAQSRRVDAAAGRALAGPHRTDLAVWHAGTGQAADRCSTGEQKALLLSIILAHGDIVAQARGQRPILLLDELAAHLDPERRAALFHRLAAGGGQVWMTGTEMALFNAVPAGATRLTICNGGVEETG
ncbi:MAG: DNA replication/repair protein RecF [Sphingopyxis sp.]